MYSYKEKINSYSRPIHRSLRGEETKEIATKSLNVFVSKATLGVGEKLELSIKITPSKTTDKLSCTSSEPSVAKVSKKGIIQAKKKGTATISIKSGKFTKKVKITVKKSPSKVTLKKKNISLKKKGNYQIRVKLPARKRAHAIFPYKLSMAKSR